MWSTMFRNKTQRSKRLRQGTKWKYLKLTPEALPSGIDRWTLVSLGFRPPAKHTSCTRVCLPARRSPPVKHTVHARARCPLCDVNNHAVDVHVHLRGTQFFFCGGHHGTHQGLWKRTLCNHRHVQGVAFEETWVREDYMHRAWVDTLQLWKP